MSGTYGYSGLYPSTSVMSDSQGYLLKYMNGTITYFSPMVRINHPISGKNLWALVLQWNPSKADTIGTRIFVRFSEVSVAQGFRCSRALMRAHVASGLYTLIVWAQDGKSVCR